MKKVCFIIFIVIIICIILLLVLYKEPKVSVLCYHNIANSEEKANFPEEKDWIIDVQNFEEHLAYLKKHNYKTLTMQEFIDWKKGKMNLSPKSVLITFDDGFLSNYKYAFPLLKKYNMNATVFLIGSYMLQSGDKSWDGNVKKYMNLELIHKSQEEYPNIEFASHSVNLHYHNSVNEKRKEEMKKDLQDFKKEIVDTKIYAYPFGAYNENIISALNESDYEMAFIYGPEKKDYRKASRKDNIYKIPRLNMSYGMNKLKFGLRLLIPF